MQVKKFEAQNMKEVLQLVKQELGPDAVILSIKDHKKSFGLGGKKSIEVTAAISAKSKTEREFAERRLTETRKSEFRNTPAKHQKEFINKAVTRYRDKQTGTASKVTINRPRYIDIHDDENIDVESLMSDAVPENKFALEDTAKAGPIIPVRRSLEETEVQGLKDEIENLRSLVSDLKESASHSKGAHYPGSVYGFPYELSYSFEKLLNAGIDQQFIVECLSRANEEISPVEKKKKGFVDGWVARYLLTNTQVVPEWINSKEKGQVELFVGPGGSGKTTCLVKIATQLIKHRNKKVALITTDLFKVGGAEQLKIFSQILNVPFETIRHGSEFSNLTSKYPDVDIFLVDFPGWSLKDIAEADRYRSLLPRAGVMQRTHLVLPATSKDMDLYEACQRYAICQFDDIVFTKLDESTNHGVIFSVQKKLNRPLFCFSTGAAIPEDVELATKERVLDLIYKLTKPGFKEQ